VTVSTLGRRYASALLALASEAGKADKVAKDLRDFAGSWKTSRDLRAVFENPSVTPVARKQILKELAQATGMEPLVRDALMLVSERGRMASLPEIVESFDALAAQRAGSVRAEVVTATEMPDAYFDELKKSLERVTGKQVVIDKRVDASIIAGVVTRVGDHVYDGSIRNRLAELKGELLR
jgi:F-type H+-transporting ATPase subunit delta